MKQCFIKIFITSIYFLIFGCSGCRNTHQSPEKQEKVRVVVLCDASNSIIQLQSGDKKTGRLNKLKDYVKRIPKWYPFESVIYYYPVSNNLLSQTLISKISYNIKKTSQIEDEKQRVDDLTNELTLEIDSLAIKTNNSCILISIQRAINFLHELKLADKINENKYELIIISDMLECCMNTETTDINFNVRSLKKLNDEITSFDNENPTIDVSDLALKIKVLVNSPGMDDRFEAIKETWEKWFFKIGVKKDDLNFYTGEPEIEENKLLSRI